jgi:hypothetical protein
MEGTSLFSFAFEGKSILWKLWKQPANGLFVVFANDSHGKNDKSSENASRSTYVGSLTNSMKHGNINQCEDQ